MKVNFTETDYTLIGMLLILIITTVYTYTENRNATYDLVLVEGSIEEKFTFSSTGGDFYYPHASFRLKGYDKYFYCSHCRYKALNIDLAKSLSAGDAVRISGLKTDDGFVVYDIRANSKSVILDLNDVIKCDRGEWKKPFLFIILILIVMTFRYVVKRRKYYSR